MLSGVQPTGTLLLGNYLGAIRNWVNLQDLYGAAPAPRPLPTGRVPRFRARVSRSTPCLPAPLAEAPRRSAGKSSARRAQTRTSASWTCTRSRCRTTRPSCARRRARARRCTWRPASTPTVRPSSCSRTCPRTPSWPGCCSATRRLGARPRRRAVLPAPLRLFRTPRSAVVAQVDARADSQGACAAGCGA